MIRRSATAAAASFGVVLCATLRFAVPSALVVVGTTGCLSFSHLNKKTDVAEGKLYEPGSADYDAFFKDLYDVQLLMGQAPERDATARRNVAEALSLAPDAPTDKIGDTLYERAAILAKAGVSLKLSLEGLDEGNPSATIVTIGEVKDGKDQKLVDALDAAVKEEAQLLGDLRKTRSPLEKLRGRAAALEPKIESTFTSRSTQTEVRKNFDDARQLVPLMVERSDEVHRQTTYFLKTMQKVLGAPTSVGGPTAPEEPAPKKTKGKPAKDNKPRVSKPVAPPRAVPQTPKPAPAAAPKPEPAPKKEPKVAKAPAQDFEP